MSTLKISIDRRRIKKDGTFPVILRIYHVSKYITVRSNISVHSKDWDSMNNHDENFKSEILKCASLSELTKLFHSHKDKQDEYRNDFIDRKVKLNHQPV